MIKTILVAIADPKIRTEIISVLRLGNQYEIVDAFQLGLDAEKYIMDNNPDTAILDLKMLLSCGLTIASRVKDLGMQTKIILRAVSRDPETLRIALENNVLGYSFLSDKLRVLECVEAVSNNEYFIDTELYHLHYFAATV